MPANYTIMKLLTTPIKDLFVIEPTVFSDQRGYFFESYNNRFFEKSGIKATFMQDNESFSSYGVLRGLHFQTGKDAQAKLVRVISGKVLDVAVDLRLASETFGKHFALRLSGENKKQLFIPRGFAHGFVVLSKTAVLQYKCDNYYNKDTESGLNFADPALGIDWLIPEGDMIVNERDKNFGTLEEFKQNNS
jgi:dTDP-4-dehydrorhamnose 3,5-epimerase